VQNPEKLAQVQVLNDCQKIVYLEIGP